MNNIQKALLWAGAIIAFALVATAGWVEDDVAQTMFVMLPVLAWATLGQSRSCMSCLITRTGDRS